MSRKGWPPKVVACGRGSRFAPEVIDVGLVELPELLALEGQLAPDDAGWAQARVGQEQSGGGTDGEAVASPRSGRTESRLCFRVAQATCADRPNDATAMTTTTPQTAMAVFASISTSRPGKQPDPDTSMLSDLSSRVTTTDAISGHYGPPDEA